MHIITDVGHALDVMRARHPYVAAHLAIDGDHLIWTGAMNSNGTAVASVRSRVVVVARLVYSVIDPSVTPRCRGTQPRLHRTCDRQRCVAPSHREPRLVVPR